MFGIFAQTMTPATLRSDALAGLLGALLALPQGIAFATLAGLPPQYGIYSAIVPCAVAALFGSSRHVVSGPTNANSLALFAALSPLAIPGSPAYIALALAVTGLVGVLQLALGALRLGRITDFIAPATLQGFIGGAALLIGLYAAPDFLGLAAPAKHDAASVVAGLVSGIGAANPAAVAVAATTLIAAVAAARASRKSPYLLIGIIAGYAVSELLARWPNWPSVKRIGAIPSVLPPFSLPEASLAMLPDLAAIAAALSIVALGQSVSIAKAMALRSGQRLDIDQEFIGQGLSNIAGSFFSSYLSCGSLNRSLPNYLSGARTALAAFLSALFLVGLAFATRPLLERMPMPAIAALLVYTAIGLVDLGGFVRLARTHRADFAVAAFTLAGMLVLPFQQVILGGSGLALLLYLNRTARPAVRTLVPDPQSPTRAFKPLEDFDRPMPQCPQLRLARIEGSIYFGAAGYVASRLDQMRAGPSQTRLLVMVKSVNHIDLAGVEVCDQELAARRASGGDLYFHRPRNDVRRLWKKTGFEERLGPDHIFATKADAIASIYAELDPAICATCTARIFAECQTICAASDGRSGSGAADP